MVSRTRLLGTLAIAGMFITAPVHAVQLHRAAAEGDVEEIRRLIAQGTDPNARTNDGWTAVIVASQQGHAEIVRLLLLNGADVSAKNDKGATALFIAAQNGHAEVITLLLSDGAEVDARTNDGATGLMMASASGYVEAVTLLLSNGAEVDSRTNVGLTALLYASQGGRGEVVRLLLSNGANVNAKHDGGATGLMVASQNGHGEVVKLLLSNGADVSAEFNGLTAIRMAEQRGHQEIVEALRNANAVAAQSQSGFECRVTQSLGPSRGNAAMTWQDQPGHFAGRDNEGRVLIVAAFFSFATGEMFLNAFVSNNSTEIVDAAGNAAQLPSGPTGVCVPIRFWATGERLDRIVVLETPLSPSASTDSADASGSVPSARPDAAGTQDGCYQSFERAYPDRSRLPPYHRVQELDVRPDRQSGPLPKYPEGLRSQGITGTVELAFLILPNGKADYPVVSRMSHPGFVDPARDVILGTRFRPGEVAGRPVATLQCMTIGFSIR